MVPISVLHFPSTLTETYLRKTLYHCTFFGCFFLLLSFIRLSFFVPCEVYFVNIMNAQGQCPSFGALVSFLHGGLTTDCKILSIMELCAIAHFHFNGKSLHQDDCLKKLAFLYCIVNQIESMFRGSI